MKVVAILNEKERVITVVDSDLRWAMYSIQHFAERKNMEQLVASPGPGVIELNPEYTWQFVIDNGLYEFDTHATLIPCYRAQQH